MFKLYLSNKTNTVNASAWHYSVIPEKSYDINLGEFYTYGIKLYEQGREETLHDISVCKETVEEIVELLNLNQAFPCHFKDIVEDLLP